jgi:hypothetical protein
MPIAPILVALAAALPNALPAPALAPDLPAPGASAEPVALDAAAAALRALALASAGDPRVEDVRAAAAREADRAAPIASGWGRRVRLAALLPRLTAEWRHDEEAYRVVGLQASGEVDYQHLSPGTTFAVRATWELGALVASRDELAAASAAAARAQRREEAVARASALFHERRRARVALLLAPPAAPLARAEAELAVARMTAELDALTGGLFARGGRP